MKIINFISGKDLGGPKQSFVLYSELLKSLGYDVFSVIKHGAHLKSIMQSMRIDVCEVSYVRSTHPLLINRSIQKLKSAFHSMNADVIFVHKQIDIELVRKALGSGIKIFGIIHGYNSRHTEYADALIAVSEKVKQFFIDSGYKKPIYVVPNMVKIEQKPTYRGLPETPLIGAMGIFRRKKGFHVLIKSFSIIKQRGVPFRAVIAGKGRISWYLKYLRWKLDLTKELTIRGWVSNNDRDEFVDSIDLYVLPSRTESFGMVVVEAMARMKLVIATKCGGPEEIITDNFNGYLVEKENPEVMANKLIELMKNPENTEYIANNAYITALNKYTIQSVSKQISRIVESTQ